MFSRLKIWYFFDHSEIKPEKKKSFKAFNTSAFAYEICFILRVKMQWFCILFTLTSRIWGTEDNTNISVRGGVAAGAGGSWEVAQPCRSRAEELAQVPSRALPRHHPCYLVCCPLQSSVLWRPPPAAPDRQGPSTRLCLHAAPEHMRKESLAQLPETSFSCILVCGCTVAKLIVGAGSQTCKERGGQAGLQSTLVQWGPWHPVLSKFSFHFLLSSVFSGDFAFPDVFDLSTWSITPPAAFATSFLDLSFITPTTSPVYRVYWYAWEEGHPSPVCYIFTNSSSTFVFLRKIIPLFSSFPFLFHF